MPPQFPRPILIESTKYDGSPHYKFDATLLSHDGPLLTALVEARTVMDGYRGNVTIRTSFTALFWTDRHYNAYQNFRPVGGRGVFVYANVGTPAQLDGDVIRWVDLDLDVFIDGNREVTLDDVGEFEEHRERFGYPDDLVAEICAARDELLKLAHAGEYPFDPTPRED
ncbi:MAG TPA: DUF402 domain-containing protein [Dehalococcoidia bacterium]|jgi:protein associated with RNAse G/E|nr:DUF402 domain-containing protein [Dehalococcoidia bacterium]